MGRRSLEEIRLLIWARLAYISVALLTELAEMAKRVSPSRAFDDGYAIAVREGLAGLQAVGVAKTCRWLAYIRRDYGDAALEETVSLAMAHKKAAAPPHGGEGK